MESETKVCGVNWDFGYTCALPEGHDGPHRGMGNAHPKVRERCDPTYEGFRGFDGLSSNASPWRPIGEEQKDGSAIIAMIETNNGLDVAKVSWDGAAAAELVGEDCWWYCDLLDLYVSATHYLPGVTLPDPPTERVCSLRPVSS